MHYRELLLEIGCEEMPASWIPGIEKQLAERLTVRLEEVRVERRTPVRTFVGPRRLVATVAELADRQSDLEETVTGPPVRAAFDARGEPTRAAEGFARKQGVEVAELTRVETPKGEYLACHRRQAGESYGVRTGRCARRHAPRPGVSEGDALGCDPRRRPRRVPLWPAHSLVRFPVRLERGAVRDRPDPGRGDGGCGAGPGRQRHLRAPVLRQRRHGRERRSR